MCTGAEPEVAAEVAGSAKGAGEAAAGAEAATAGGAEVLGGAEALGAGALGAETLGGGLGGAELGAAAPALTDAASIAGDVGLSSEAAAGLPQVGTGAADIAGGDLAGGATAGADTIVPPATGLPPTTDLSTIAPSSAPVTDLSTGVKGAPGFGQSMLNAVTKNPLTTAAVGLNAASAIGQRNAGKDAASQLGKIAAPFQKEGQTLLEQYHAGKLNPADEFNINKWEHEAIAAAQSGPEGRQGGRALQSRLEGIRAQAQAMRDQALNGLLDSGLKAMGMATGPLTNAVTAQASQDHAFQQAQSSALQSFLLLQAMQSGRVG